MVTEISKVSRCQRCGKVAHGITVTTVGNLCVRCLSELGDLLRAFMRSA